MRSYARELLIVAVLVTLIGAGLATWGMGESRRLTGEWIGYPLPNAVAGTIGIGMLTVILGVMFLLAIAIVSIADRPKIRRVLNQPVFAEDTIAARLGRTILRAQRAWDIGIGLLMIGVLVVAAFQNQLVAMILGATALLVVVIYFLAKRKTDNGGHVV